MDDLKKVEQAPTARETSRREFIRELGGGLLAATGLAVLLAKRSSAAQKEGADIMDRMQADLKRALQKPAEQRRWAMAIDQKKCIGCRSCTVACRAENKTPPGVTYNPVFEEMKGTYPSPKREFLPRPCMHCAKPSCLEACPQSAIKRRPDGIVYIDYDVCTGIQACVGACPYGVPIYDEGKYFTENTPQVQAYENAAAFEMGVKRTRDAADKSPIGKARKCTYCFHRLDAGMLTACTTTCLGNAIFFGDLNDPESLVAELAKSSRVKRLKTEEGTQPTTFYLA